MPCKNKPTLSDGLMGFRWQIEELRVSLFAQELKTPMPVSVKRLDEGVEFYKLKFRDEYKMPP